MRPRLGVTAIRAWLCRHGIHRWDFVMPNFTGDGCFERCRDCPQLALLMFAGARIYVTEQQHAGIQEQRQW